MNKLCDAGDWARPEIDRIIRDEFGEVPRFHRKQWEFAVLYRELERRGLLNEGRAGISFGSATEIMLYAVARRVRHLWATDLYGADSTWDIARTTDPTQLVSSKAPFPYPSERLSAKSMDMREIAFPDESFDFAYSSCAVEHIGAREDFIRHLREVARVLKPGGVYAFTTELTYNEATIESPGNFYFSRHMLEELVRESGMYSEPEFDARLAMNRANTPLPHEFAGGMLDGDGHFTERLFGLISVVQLTIATSPFTSCLVVLEKTGQRFAGWDYRAWDDTRRFIDSGLQAVREIVEGAELRLAPFVWMPRRKSIFYLGHREFFDSGREERPADTLFHTGYFWLGGKRRTLRVALWVRAQQPYRVRLKIHRCRGSTPWMVELDSHIDVDGTGDGLIKEVVLEPDDESTYAVLAERLEGELALVEVAVTVAAAGSQPLIETALSALTGEPAGRLRDGGEPDDAA